MGGFDGSSRLTVPIVFERKQLVSLKRTKDKKEVWWNRVDPLGSCCSEVAVNGYAVLTLPSHSGPPRGCLGTQALLLPISIHAQV